jgi:inosine-uridine nucleoside N-ribohydrolase
MNYEQKYLKYKQKYVQALTKQTGGARQKIIIDTDPGIDDALAILLALGNPKVEVIALTTVFGNFPYVNILTDNALKILNLVKIDIPVYEGETKPLTVESKDMAAYNEDQMKKAQSMAVHGRDGLANLSEVEATRLEKGRLEKQSEHAADAIIRLATEFPGEIKLVTLGPLTNLALALKRDSTLKDKLHSVIIMGGSLFSPRGNAVNTPDANLGNARPSAEANFFKDPLAAQKVLRDAKFEPSKLFLVPLDLTTQTDYIQFGLTKDPTSLPTLEPGIIRDFIVNSHDYYQNVYITKFLRKKVPFHDACAVFMAISPESFTNCEEVSINVETAGIFTAGMTIIDNRKDAKPPIRDPNNIIFYQNINVFSLYQAIIASINNLQRKLSSKP